MLEYESPTTEIREFKILKNHIDLLAFICDSSLRSFCGEILPSSLFDCLSKVKASIQDLQLEYSNSLRFTFKQLHYDNF